MWDEREGFARGVLKVLAWVLLAIGVTTAGASLVYRTPDYFLAFLTFLGFLASVLLLWALAIWSVMAVVYTFMTVSGWLTWRRFRR